ncbi:hypothetical protein B0H11DRAFT_1902970 [Mycena galericulata]|nr:hypothetical protein B0H11DRAFT_1902970 [Mycena galericulata]
MIKRKKARKVRHDFTTRARVERGLCKDDWYMSAFELRAGVFRNAIGFCGEVNGHGQVAIAVHRAVVSYTRPKIITRWSKRREEQGPGETQQSGPDPELNGDAANIAERIFHILRAEAFRNAIASTDRICQHGQVGQFMVDMIPPPAVFEPEERFETAPGYIQFGMKVKIENPYLLWRVIGLPTILVFTGGRVLSTACCPVPVGSLPDGIDGAGSNLILNLAQVQQSAVRSFTGRQPSFGRPIPSRAPQLEKTATFLTASLRVYDSKGTMDIAWEENGTQKIRETGFEAHIYMVGCDSTVPEGNGKRCPVAGKKKTSQVRDKMQANIRVAIQYDQAASNINSAEVIWHVIGGTNAEALGWSTIRKSEEGR